MAQTDDLRTLLDIDADAVAVIVGVRPALTEATPEPDLEPDHAIVDPTLCVVCGDGFCDGCMVCLIED